MKIMTANDDHTTGRTELSAGDVLYDAENSERYAVIVAITDAGVTIRRNGTEQFIPHALFLPWNDASLVVGRPKTGTSKTNNAAPPTERTA